jgi:ribonucleoside-diphosphate reductase alpha chain
MRIERRYTTKGNSPYAEIEFRTTTVELRNSDGSIAFQMGECVLPAAWSNVAANILAKKYFRKTGVPTTLRRVEENGVPSWLWRSMLRPTLELQVPGRAGLEPSEGVEPPSSTYNAAALPLSYLGNPDK